MRVVLGLEDFETNLSFSDTLDAHLVTASKSTRVANAYRLDDQGVDDDARSLLPFSTLKSGLSFSWVRGRALPTSFTPATVRGAIFVMKSSYGGGKTKAMFTLCAALQKQGFSMRLVALELGREPARFALPDGVAFDFVDSPGHGLPTEEPLDGVGLGIVSSPRRRRRLVDYLGRMDVDFVYLPNYAPALHDLFSDALPSRTAVIVGEHNSRRSAHVIAHGTWSEREWDRHFLRVLERADAAHCIVPQVEQALAAISSARTFFVPNAVDPPRESSSPTRFCELRRILAVGRLDPVKQFDLLIRAFASVSSEFSHWVLDIYGDGAERVALERLVIDLQLRDRVRIHGFVDDLHERYVDHALHVSSSKAESFGLTLVEAMMVRVPCLAIRHPGSTYLLGKHGERGTVVEHNDVESFTSALRTVLNQIETRDEELIARTQRAREFALQFSPHEVGRLWREQILELVENRKRSGAT